MKIFDPEKMKRVPAESWAKARRAVGLVIFVDLLMLFSFIALKLGLHQPLNTPSCLFAFAVTGISIFGLCALWLLVRMAFRQIPRSKR